MPKIEDLIPDRWLIENWGVKPVTLAGWRSRGLPWVSLGRGVHGYWADDLVAFLAGALTHRPKKGEGLLAAPTQDA